MNINTSRYMDSIGVSKNKKQTLLNKWHDYNWMKFYNKYEKEFTIHNHIYVKLYDACSFKEWQEISKYVDKLQPSELHKFEYFICNIPSSINSWLCCGFKCHYDKNINQWTHSDKYHMMSKLCRYETWKNVKITLWDKLRFKWITGYNFE